MGDVDVSVFHSLNLCSRLNTRLISLSGVLIDLRTEAFMGMALVWLYRSVWSMFALDMSRWVPSCLWSTSVVVCFRLLANSLLWCGWSLLCQTTYVTSLPPHLLLSRPYAMCSLPSGSGCGSASNNRTSSCCLLSSLLVSQHITQFYCCKAVGLTAYRLLQPVPVILTR